MGQHNVSSDERAQQAETAAQRLLPAEKQRIADDGETQSQRPVYDPVAMQGLTCPAIDPRRQKRTPAHKEPPAQEQHPEGQPLSLEDPSLVCPQRFGQSQQIGIEDDYRHYRGHTQCPPAQAGPLKAQKRPTQMKKQPGED